LIRGLFMGKRPAEVLGEAKAKKFDDALDFVIQNRESTSIEFSQILALVVWFVARLAPVYDRNGTIRSVFRDQ